MKLIRFDANTASGFRSGESTIRFNAAGAVSLSKTFVQKAKLKKTDKVFVAQDEENPTDWYLVVDNKNGFPLRAGSNGEGMQFNNAYTSKSVMEALDISARSVAFRIATEPADVDDPELKKHSVFAILTATAKYQAITEEEEVG
jgi:hypothetical protein